MITNCTSRSIVICNMHKFWSHDVPQAIHRHKSLCDFHAAHITGPQSCSKSQLGPPVLGNPRLPQCTSGRNKNVPKTLKILALSRLVCPQHFDAKSAQMNIFWDEIIEGERSFLGGKFITSKSYLLKEPKSQHFLVVNV